MPSKSEDAKGIFVSLIRTYLIQVSSTVQEMMVNKGVMQKDVRGAYVAQLDVIWKSVLPKLVGKYNGKLYKQIYENLVSGFNKRKCWLVKEGDVASQLHAIVFGEPPSGPHGQDGDLVLFAKVMEFLSAQLAHSKTLMAEIVKVINVADITPETRKSINDAIEKAMSDFVTTVTNVQAQAQQERSSSRREHREHRSNREPQEPAVNIEQMRNAMETEYHEMYQGIFNEKMTAYKARMSKNFNALTARNQELEEELEVAKSTIIKLREALEDAIEDAESVRGDLVSFGSTRPSREACLNFGSTLDKMLDDDLEDLDDSDNDSSIGEDEDEEEEEEEEEHVEIASDEPEEEEPEEEEPEEEEPEEEEPEEEEPEEEQKVVKPVFVPKTFGRFGFGRR